MTTLNKTPKEVDDATALVPKPETVKSILWSWVVIALSVFIVGGGLFFAWHKFLRLHEGPARCAAANLQVMRPQAELVAGSGRRYDLEFAKTEAERTKGLSGRPCIPEQTGLVFYFDTADTYGIWMKDMKFAIDVVWLDANKKVVYAEQNMTPESYPNVFKPSEPAQFIIEMNTGVIATQGIAVGTTLQW